MKMQVFLYVMKMTIIVGELMDTSAINRSYSVLLF